MPLQVRAQAPRSIVIPHQHHVNLDRVNVDHMTQYHMISSCSILRSSTLVFYHHRNPAELIF